MPSGRRATTKDFEQTTYVPSRSSSSSSESASIAVPVVNSGGPEMVALPRAEYDALVDRIARLESTVASRTGTDAGQVIQRSTTINGDYDTNPRHDPDYMKAAGCVPGYLPDPEAMKRTFAAAQARVAAARQAQSQPVRNDQFPDWSESDSHVQRRAQAQAGQDMSHVLSQGGVSTRSPSGQVTTVFPAQATCPNGHPAEESHKFCTICGEVIAAPPLGRGWDEEQALRAQRLREEGVVGG